MRLLKIFYIIVFIFILNINKVSAFSYGPDVTNAQNVETLILIDLSSSMLLPVDDGSRIEVAINTAYRLVGQYNNNNKIGLRVIGFAEPINVTPEFFYSLTKTDLCLKTSTPIPIGRNNISRLQNKILSLSPFGDTPLEYSLKQAIYNDFSQGNALKHIILITDGGETCGGNPCAFFKNLMAYRNDIKIDVIAISPDAQYIPLYECLTDATGGKVTEINNIRDINPTLTKYINPPINTPDISANDINMDNIDAIFSNIDSKFPKFDFNFKSSPDRDVKFKNYTLEHIEK